MCVLLFIVVLVGVGVVVVVVFINVLKDGMFPSVFR